MEGVRFESTRGNATERHIGCDSVFENIGLQPSSEVFFELNILDDMGFIELEELNPLGPIMVGFCSKTSGPCKSTKAIY